MLHQKEPEVYISLRFSQAEHEAIRKKAEDSHVSVPAFIKKTMLSESAVDESPERKYTPATRHELEILRRFPILSELSDEEISDVIHKLSISSFKKGDVVIEEENSNDFMYMILRGSVRVFITNEEGREITLAIHKTGAFFGEMSLIDGQTASATVMASEDSSVLMISRNDFYSLIFRNKKILKGLLHTFCNRIRASNKTIEMMSHISATHRVKDLLLSLSERCGIKKDGRIVLDFPLTHQEIANMTGLTRETVTKIMNEMKMTGMIEIDRQKVTIVKKLFLNQ